MTTSNVDMQKYEELLMLLDENSFSFINPESSTSYKTVHTTNVNEMMPLHQFKLIVGHNNSRIVGTVEAKRNLKLMSGRMF